MRGIPRAGRSPRPYLPKRQIATQDGESRGAEGFGQRDQQRSLRVSPCAVRQYQPVMVGIFRNVQKSANVGFRGIIEKWLCGRDGQATIVIATQPREYRLVLRVGCLRLVTRTF